MALQFIKTMGRFNAYPWFASAGWPQAYEGPWAGPLKKKPNPSKMALMKSARIPGLFMVSACSQFLGSCQGKTRGTIAS
jgi:hypothetical protein